MGQLFVPLNFLLHAHLALRDLGSPTAAVGAMLPDLWRMAHRRAHAHRLPTHVEAPGLRAGLAHHAAADRWFHDAPELHRGEELLRTIFAAEGIRAPKLRLFAHPLWEICLDGALVRRQGSGPLRAWLQEAFAGAARERDAGQQALGGVLGPDGDAFAARMDRIVRELLRGPWIDAYAGGEGVAWCLDAMRARAGLERLAPDDLATLARRIDETAPEADRGLAGLLEEANRGLAGLHEEADRGLAGLQEEAARGISAPR